VGQIFEAVTGSEASTWKLKRPPNYTQDNVEDGIPRSHQQFNDNFICGEPRGQVSVGSPMRVIIDDGNLDIFLRSVTVVQIHRQSSDSIEH
jgi:hypothetical protein